MSSLAAAAMKMMQTASRLKAARIFKEMASDIPTLKVELQNYATIEAQIDFVIEIQRRMTLAIRSRATE